MELKINEYQLPEKILFNYEELKKELTEKVSMYETLVYTDEQIKNAKEDRANLNKLKKALNDERIRREKEYLQPFNEFKAQINEIIGIIDKPVAVIDKQIKAYEETQNAKKMEAIQEYWTSIGKPGTLSFEKIYDSKWLNASVSMKSIKESIKSAIEKFNTDMTTLENLPEFGFEAQQVYISTLDINKALAEGQRMAQVAKAKAEREETMRKLAEEQAQRKAEEEARKAAEQVTTVKDLDGSVYVQDADKQGWTKQEPPVVDEEFEAKAFGTNPPQPEKQWVKFQALMTIEDALALKAFFESRHIELKAV